MQHNKRTTDNTARVPEMRCFGGIYKCVSFSMTAVLISGVKFEGIEAGSGTEAVEREILFEKRRKCRFM